MSKRIITSIVLAAVLFCTAFIPAYSSLMTIIINEDEAMEQTVVQEESAEVFSLNNTSSVSSYDLGQYKSEQYSTDMSAAYAGRNTPEEYVDTQSGILTISQIDYTVPMVNNNFEIKRIFNSAGASQDVEADGSGGITISTDSFYKKAYGLGNGWRFSFPVLEVIKTNSDIQNIIYHSESGAVYTITPEDSENTSLADTEFNISNHKLNDMKIKYCCDASDNLQAIEITHIKEGVIYTFSTDGKINTITFIDESLNFIGAEHVKFSYDNNLIKTIDIKIGIDKDVYVTNTATFSYVEGMLSNIQFTNGDKISYETADGQLVKVFDIDNKVKNMYFYNDDVTLKKYVPTQNSTSVTRDVKTDVLTGILYCRDNRLSKYTYTIYKPDVNNKSSRLKASTHQDYTVVSDTKESDEELFGYNVKALGPETQYHCADDKGVIEKIADGSFVWTNKDNPSDYFIGNAKNAKRLKIQKSDATAANEVKIYVKPTEDEFSIKVNGETCDSITESNTEEKPTESTTEGATEVVEPEEDLWVYTTSIEESTETGEYCSLNISHIGAEVEKIVVSNVAKYIASEELKIYNESFGSMNSSFWKQNTHTDTSGGFDFRSNYMHSWRRMHSEMISQETYEDFVLDTTIQFMKYPITDHTSAGVVFWVNNLNPGNNNFDGYYVRISPETDNTQNRSTIGLFRMRSNNSNPYNNETATQLVVKDFADTNLGKQCDSSKAYALRVKAVGSIVEVYVVDMDTPVIVYDCSSNGGTCSGSVGVRTFQRRAAYSSFSVTSGEYQKVATKTEIADNPEKAGEKITTVTSDIYNFENNLIMQQVVAENYKTIKAYEYDENRMPKQVTTYEYEKSGDKFELKYTSSESYIYDNYGNLIEYRNPMAHKVDDAGSAESEDLNEGELRPYVTKYEYDTTWGLLKQKTMLQDDGTKLTYKYDLTTNSNMIESESIFVNEEETPTRVTEYRYNNYCRLVSKKVTESGEAVYTGYKYSKTNSSNEYTITEILYENVPVEETPTEDATDVEAVSEGEGDSSGISKETTIDALTGNIDSTADYNGNVTRYEYDAAHRLIKITHPDNTVVEYIYTESNYIDSENLAAEIKTNSTTYINENKKNVITEYDAYGRAVKRISGDDSGVVIENKYDERGNLIWAKDGNGNVTVCVYDSLNRMIRKISKTKHPENDDEYLDVYTYTEEYSYGYVVEGEESYHSVTTTYGDGEGSNIVIYDSLNREISSKFGNYPETISEYDYLGNKSAITDANGNKTEFVYDALGRLVTSKKANGDITAYTYNVFDTVSTKIEENALCEYEYDFAGRVLNEKYYSLKENGTKDDTKYYFVDYTYDANGNILTTQKGVYSNGEEAVSEKTSYDYYPRNTVKSKTTYIEDLTAQVTTYKYDNCGNLTVEKECIVPIEIKSDEATESSSDEIVVVEESTEAVEDGTEVDTEEDTTANYTTTRTYDYANRVLSETVTDDDKNVLVAVAYEYDDNGNVTKKTVGGLSELYSYDVLGNVTKKTMPNGLEINYTYDVRGNVLSETYKRDNSVEITQTYTYDDAGNLETVADAENNVTRYECDGTGNVVAVYDPRYSTTKSSYIRYEYDERNRKMRTIAVDGDDETVVEELVYDSIGNIVEKKNGDIVFTYTYDASNNLVTETDGEGFSTNYTYDGSGRVTCVTTDENNVTTTEYYLNGMVKKITYADGKTVSYDISDYDATGKYKSAVKDRMGNKVVTEYDVLGNPETVSCYYPIGNDYILGYAETYEYDDWGRKTGYTNREGRYTKYTYNDAGNLTNEDLYVDKAAADAEEKALISMAYTYTNDGLLLTATDACKNTTNYTYDKCGNAVEIKYPEGNTDSFAYTEGMLSKATKAGVETSYTYDVLGRTILETTYDRNVGYEYDEAGNVIGTVVFTGTNQTLVGSTSYTYDKAGRILEESVMRNVSEYDTVSYTYDAEGRVKTKTIHSEPKHITTYEYDKMGNIISETVNDSSETDVRVNYEYDLLGRVVSATPAYPVVDDGEYSGAKTEYFYDHFGNMYAQRDMKGYYTLYTYDIMGRLLTSADEISNPGMAEIINNEGLVTYKNDNEFTKAMTYVYDELGNKTSETNALNKSNSYTYDNCGRVLTVTTPDKEIVSTKEYDANGNLVSDTDAKDNAVTYVYDYENNHGRLMSEIDRNGVEVRRYTYNEYGEVLTVEEVVSPESSEVETPTEESETDATEEETSEETTGEVVNVTTYYYDGAGRLKRLEMPEDVTEEYTYDLAGNMLSQTNGEGHVTEYEYYPFGKLKSLTSADGNVESYEYDSYGNLVKKIDGNGTIIVYEYDVRNNLTQVSYGDKVITYNYDILNNRTEMTDESCTDEFDTYEYTYDAGSRLITVKKDGSAYLDYEYDKLGNVTKINHLSYTYDECSRMATVDADGNATNGKDITYSYDKNGNLATVAYLSGGVTTYNYDKNNRVTKVENKVNDEVLTSYTYTYYVNGMEKSKNDGSKIVYYTYDGAGRLSYVAEKQSDKVIRTATYTYDKANNRISYVEECESTETVNGAEVSFDEKVTQYLYNSADVITLQKEVYKSNDEEVASKSLRYVYDKAGNQVSTTAEYVTSVVETTDSTEATEETTEATDEIKVGTEVWIEVTINEYNELNQLVGYTSINGDERSYSSYVYNGDNLRVQKTVDGEVTDYLLSGDYVIEETGKTYLFGMSYHGFATGEGEYLYLTNSHGDVTRVLGGDMTTVAAYDYDEFGNLTYENSSIENDVLYSGEFYDSESENYYLRARYYDPSIGRFTQADSFLGVVDNPLSLNRYTYCHNNPIMFIDPSGHEIKTFDRGGVIYSYDTSDFKSSKQDYESSIWMGKYERGEIDDSQFFAQMNELQINFRVIGMHINGESVENTNGIVDNIPAEDVKIIFEEPLSYVDSGFATSWFSEYKAGNLTEENLKRHLNDHSAMKIINGETKIHYGLGEYNRDDEYPALFANPYSAIMSSENAEELIDFADKHNDILGHYEDKKTGKTVFYYKQGTVQKYFGYTNLYDDLAEFCGMYLNTVRVDFNYNGEKWRIQLWKGQYGVLTGGEIGIYRGGTDWGLYKCATDYQLNMNFTLKDKNSNTIFTSRSDAAWWQTGFVFGLDYGKDTELTMNGNISFKDSKMASSFLSGLTSQGITATQSDNIVTFTWKNEGIDL